MYICQGTQTLVVIKGLKIWAQKFSAVNTHLIPI